MRPDAVDRRREGARVAARATWRDARRRRARARRARAPRRARARAVACAVASHCLRIRARGRPPRGPLVGVERLRSRVTRARSSDDAPRDRDRWIWRITETTAADDPGAARVPACPNCGKHEIKLEPALGSEICQACGVVYNASVLQTTLNWTEDGAADGTFLQDGAHVGAHLAAARAQMVSMPGASHVTRNMFRDRESTNLYHIAKSVEHTGALLKVEQGYHRRGEGSGDASVGWEMGTGVVDEPVDGSVRVLGV